MRKKNPILAIAVIAALLPVLFTGCSEKARMARHERRADEYFASGEYSKAEVEYLNTLRLKPDNSHAFSRLGSLYFQQGRFARAFAFLNKASQLTPGDMDVHVKLASIYLTAQQTKEAQQQATLVLDKSPTNAEAPILLAEAVASAAEMDAARTELGKVSKQIGDTAGVQLALGVLAMKSGDLKGAESSIKRALVLDPKSSAAYFALGTLYTAQNNLKDADAAFKSASDLAPARSTKRLSYAVFKIKNGELAEGKRLLAEITKEAPDYIPAWIQQAEIALSEKRFDDCSSLLDQALGRDVDNYQALLLRGRLRLAQGEVEKARTELEHAAAVYDASAQIQYHLALAYSLGNDSAKALASVNKALSLNPDFPDAILMLAQLNLRRGNIDAAITPLTQLVKQHPQIAPAHVLLASAYLAQNNPDRAVSIYSHMAELFPKSAQVPLLTGMIQSQQNKLAEARKSFEHAIDLEPHFLPAVEALVDLDIVQKRFSAAQERVQKEIDQQPKLAEPQLLLAKVCMARVNEVMAQATKANASATFQNTPAALADIAQAEAALQKAIDLRPDLSSSYFMLAQLYTSTGKEQAALDRLNGLVTKTNDPGAYLQIGIIHEALKQYPEARDAYEKVLSSKADFFVALNNLAYLYLAHLGDLDKAYNYAQKAHDAMPDDPSSSDTLGWILFKRGDYARALSLLEGSAAKLGDEPEVLYHVGMARYMMGNEAGARTALGRASASPKDFPEKAEIASRLALLNLDPKSADAKAFADLKKRLEDQPNDPVVAVRVAAIYERDGDLNNAAKAYEKVLAQNSNAQIMGRLAQIYANLKDQKKALDLAKQAHNLAPDNATITLMLGRLAAQSGDYNYALNLLQDASRRLPDQVDISYDLAWANYAVGRMSEAETSMRTAQPALSGPKLEDAKRFLTLVAAAKNPASAQAANAQASQILNNEPNYVPALVVTAVQQQQQGKLDDAAKSFEKVVGLYPAFTPAIRNLALLYANSANNDQRAYDLANQARSSQPNDPELARALGLIVYRRGDYAKSAQLLKESAQKINNDPEIFYYLGMDYFQLKQKLESKDALQKALSLNLSTKLADEARKTIAQLK